jgi:heme exporter protein A
MTLLCGVDFSLSAGQILVLRGANGLGKTSLLRCIAGLQDPVEGQITRQRQWPIRAMLMV